MRIFMEPGLGSIVLAFLSALWLLALTVHSGEARSALLPPEAGTGQPLTNTAHPFAPANNLFLERQANALDFKPTALTRNDYLRAIEGQVKTMRGWQNADGRIVDPVRKRECYYTTPCYAHAVAAVVAGGLNTEPELLESGLKAMDIATADMASGDAADGHGDFFIYPVMMAFNLYAKVAPEERVAVWRERLAAINPKKLYRAYGKSEGNWAIVNLSGEFLRAAAGLTSLEYVDATLKAQRRNFTELGMYDEHGHPLPYDHFPRHFLSGILRQGYAGAEAEACRALLWKAAWVSLFMQSPFGELPTGYRSSHHIWNEAESAVTYELYASAYASAGRLAEAGAFKRAARLSLECVRRWTRPDGTGYIVKNRHPIEAQHGYESYSSHACYNMLACSMLAQAWQFADDAVQERPAPADIGGYVLPILKPYHKIFVAAGGNYVEYDTCGDQKYNPTGLLRIHLRNGHPQLGPSDGCAELYSGKGKSLAIGPSWKLADGEWQSLAAATPSEPQVEVLSETPDRAAVRITYADVSTKSPNPASALRLTTTITVTPAGVTVEDEVAGAKIEAMRTAWPMLVFDGLEKTGVQIEGSSATLRLNGRGVRFEVLEPRNVTLQRSGQVLKHRNGEVEAAFAEFNGTRSVVRLTAP